MQRMTVTVALVLALVALLAGCSAPPRTTSSDLQGRLIVWVNLDGKQAALVNDLLSRFNQVHPDVKIVSELVSSADVFFDDRMGQGGRLTAQAAAGLGPDVVIGLEEYRVRALLPAGLLSDLDVLNVDVSVLDEDAVDALKKDGKSYAVPLASYSNVLYYNTKKVKRPFDTTLGLLDEAEAGRKIAIPVDLTNAFWGLTAYGGPFFDDDGRVILNQAGVVRWFTWLKEASAEPNIILGEDYEALKKLFADGGADYFIGSSLELPALIERLGLDTVGVAPLPTAAYPGRPIMNVETIVITRNSTQTALAAELANFLTNEAQQRRLLLSNNGRLPINTKVVIDKRVSPIASALVTQSRETEIFSITASGTGSILREGSAITKEVIEGVLSPERAAAALMESIYKRLE